MLAAATGGGCAALFAPQARDLRAAQGAGPARVELDAVPFYPQTPFHCGPAALATVLAYRGATVDVDALARDVFVPAREGSFQVEMLAAARRVGFVATRLPGTLRALADEVDAGHPVVLLLNLGLAWQPLWHYAVLVGYDLAAPAFVLRSGTTRRDVMPAATLEATWTRVGAWAFVVTSAGAWPASAQVEAAEEAALAFERGASPATRLRVHTSLLARWPDRFVAQMGQGNALLALGRPRDAALVFDAAAHQHDRAAAWNNLAVALARAGDGDPAKAAASRALARAAQDDASLLDTVRDTHARLQRGEVP